MVLRWTIMLSHCVFTIAVLRRLQCLAPTRRYASAVQLDSITAASSLPLDFQFDLIALHFRPSAKPSSSLIHPQPFTKSNKTTNVRLSQAKGLV